MRQLKKIEDFKELNPVIGRDIKTGKDKTVTFSIEDFENVIIAIEADVIFDISEGKKTISGLFVEKVSEYLDGKVELKEVIEALEALKKEKEPA